MSVEVQFGRGWTTKLCSSSWSETWGKRRRPVLSTKNLLPGVIVGSWDGWELYVGLEDNVGDIDGLHDGPSVGACDSEGEVDGTDVKIEVRSS